MKKIFSVASIILSFIFACCIFSACDKSVSKYDISVKSQGYNLGAVEGGNATYLEGDNVTIKAIPVTTGANKSQFFCWLLNNKAVSTSAEYSFVVSQSTAGDYVALFTCPYMEYFYLNEIVFNTGITDAISDTTVKQIDIYLGDVENLLTKVYSQTFDAIDNTTVLAKEDIYKTDKMPFAYDIQKDIFIQVDVIYVQDEIEFVSTLKTKIDKNYDVTAEDVKSENQKFPQGKNLDNEDLKLKLGTDATITLKFDRLSNYKFETTEENQ